jgi:hypothetical protein
MKPLLSSFRAGTWWTLPLPLVMVRIAVLPYLGRSCCCDSSLPPVVGVRQGGGAPATRTDAPADQPTITLITRSAGCTMMGVPSLV